MHFLFLTDHTSHQKPDSFYSLMLGVADVEKDNVTYISTRGIKRNADFFNLGDISVVYGRKLDDNLDFNSKDKWFSSCEKIDLNKIDVIFLRIDHPIGKDFLIGLNSFKGLVVNDPIGTYKTGSKEYLLNFPKITPRIALVQTLDGVTEFQNGGCVVTKPLRDYGGNGLVRLNTNSGYVGNKKVSLHKAQNEVSRQLRAEQKLLVSEYLPEVKQGDKRIIIVNGKVLGSFLRLPASGSWLCNLSKGATVQASDITPEEETIISETYDLLKSDGILIYGIDTLVGNDGKRVLTEINTSNVGGFKQIEKLTGVKASKNAGIEILDFLQKQLKA